MRDLEPRRRPWRDCLPPPSHHPWPIGAPARPVEGHRAKRKPFEVKSTLIGVESSLVRSVSKQISHSHSPSAIDYWERVSDEIGASFRQASEKEAPIRGSQGDSPPLCKIPATKVWAGGGANWLLEVAAVVAGGGWETPTVQREKEREKSAPPAAAFALCLAPSSYNPATPFPARLPTTDRNHQ
ncbi:hypothetical protein Acr_10g0009550 [Actinidia rufa]|uniref:Uncharacterized protein n=1 Tax=Actinidia rufa TaxID=165716 RepID=A0A7J0FA50_9ERIC|nr:hypothetical protein Acr_10g0009550 [Actinidia rufa]